MHAGDGALLWQHHVHCVGRIGRQVARIASKDPEVDLKLINATYDVDCMTYLMKYDTIHGKYDGTIEADGDSLVIDGHRVALSHTCDPAEIPHHLAFGLGRP